MPARALKRTNHDRNKPKRAHPESDLQIEAVRLFRSVVPDHEAMLYAVPNGEKRDAITAAILKGQGVEPGVADLVLVIAGAHWYIEAKSPLLKPPLERYLSDNQVKFRDRVVSWGHKYRIFNSLDGFVEILHEAGVAKRVRISPIGVPIVLIDTPGRSVVKTGTNSAITRSHALGVAKDLL